MNAGTELDVFSIPELLFKILSDLQYSRRDLKTASVVCKSWRSVAWPLQWADAPLKALLKVVGPLQEGKK